MTAKDLKNALLQEAVQGKLVPQIASEGNARDLLEEIRKEKAKLIKEGKLKKEKPLPELTEEEIPFDIPENWCWCRWGDLSYSIQYGYNASAKEKGRIKMVRISDIHENEVIWETVPYCDINEDEIKTYLLKENDILFARTGGTVGKSFLVKNIPCEAIYAGYLIRTHYNSIKLVPEFLKLFMESDLYWSQLREGTIATAQPNCNGQTLSKMMIPLPPLAEQKRIVAAIEQFMPLIEEYDKKEAELTALNADIAKILKNAILQEAVQGKLAPQTASEGNAKDLLEEIKKEKAKLIKEGKLKKEKPLPEITEDEIPFDISESWCWCRLSEYLDIRDGTHDSPKFYDKGIPFVTSKNLNDGILDFSTCKYITEEDHKKFSARSFVEDGDILFAMIGSIGNPVIVKKEFDFSFKNMALFKRYTKEKTDMKYIFYYLSYIQSELKRIATGGVQSFIGLGTFREMLFPLPPLAEQKRIVATIEKILPLCEKLGE